MGIFFQELMVGVSGSRAVEFEAFLGGVYRHEPTIYRTLRGGSLKQFWAEFIETNHL